MRIRSLALVFLVFLIASSVAAQIPSLLVTPSKVTLVQGQSQTFRAVGADGRLLRDVRWSLSPVYAADLRTGDEAEVSSRTPKQFEIVADYQGNRAVATVTVIAGYKLPEGTVKWSVTELPGFQTGKITPAFPTAGGPDVFVEEKSATQRFIRAYTDDGRELWRYSGSETLTPEIIAEQSQPITLNKKSVCDSVKIGATKKDISALQQAADYAANPTLFGRDKWDIEENGVTCHVAFDPAGKVLRKRRELTN